MNGPVAFNELVARARSGDARAQYALAAEQSARSNQTEARYWLERAAASGFPDAIFTLSAAMLTGASGSTLDPAAAFSGLKRAADLGSKPAFRTLAALYVLGAGGDRDWPRALDVLQRACAAGDAAALLQASVLLFMMDTDDLDGAAMVHVAARTDATAATIAIRRALLSRAGSSRSAARELFEALRRAGYPLTPGLEKISSADGRNEAPPETFSLDRAFARLAGFLLNAGAPETLCASPSIRTIKGVFPPEACDYLIGAALPRLKPGEISIDESDKGGIHPHRSAWSAAFHQGAADLPVTIIAEHLALLAAIPFAQGEPLNVIRYRRGEEYRPHHDFLGSGEEDLRRRGQRVRTGLIYLNDGYLGGETHFLSPDLKVSGRAGDVLVFDNVTAEGAPDVSARHAGLPIIGGEKWLASVWYRDRPYAP